MIYIFWTAPNEREAKQIAHALLEQKLIACASLIPNVLSIYHWEGKVEESVEIKVIFKTQADHFALICTYIKSHGSYETPEITQVKVDKAAPDYLEWLKQTTDRKSFT